MNDIKRKLNKPLIVITFIILVCLSVKSHMKEVFHMDSELNHAFIVGGLVGMLAKGIVILFFIFMFSRLMIAVLLCCLVFLLLFVLLDSSLRLFFFSPGFYLPFPAPQPLHWFS